MKNGKFFKAVCLAISILFILSTVPFSAAAADQPSIGVADLTPEAFHRIVSQSVNKLPDEIYANLSLCDEDLPEAMAGSGIEETEAVVRLKGQEKELSSLLYANADGTYTEYFFAENVKFEKDGEVKDKSNKLTYVEKLGAFTNEENDINVVLPAVYSSENGVSLTYGENVISFAAEECSSSEAEYVKGENGADKIVYKDVFAHGIDLEYFAQFSGVKENIILNEKPQNNVFAFRIKTNGAYLQNENGSVIILDEKGEYIGYIGELYIYDAEGKAGTGSVRVEEISAGDEYLYILTVDTEYLNRADTVYPVTADPSFSFGNAYIFDAKLMLDNGSYSLDTTCSTVKLGYTGLNHFQRMLIKFTSIKQMVQHLGFDHISAIRLNIKRITSSYDYSSFRCFRMTSNWGSTSGSTTYSVWSGYDSSSEIVGYFYPTFDTAVIDITPYYQLWLSGSTDRGIMLQCYNESTSDTYDIATKEHSSVNGPFITLVYSMPSGLDSVGLQDGCLYTFSSINGILYPYLQSTAVTVNNNTVYSLTLNGSAISTGSTLENSPFFAVYADGSNGYFKMSPTNANYRGSSALYAGTVVNNVYYNGSSLGISESYNSSNKSSWYMIKALSGVCYILNRYYQTVAIYPNIACSSVIYGDPGFGAEECQWVVNFVGLDVPLKRQLDTHWCGPASVLKVLIYLGLSSSIPGNNDYEMQSDIAARVVHNNAGNQADMVDYLNEKINNTVYSLKITGINNYSNMITVINNSLQNNYPVIARAKPKGKITGYYTGYTSDSGHYIVVVGYDNANNLYLVRDCNNVTVNGEYRYFGEFTVDSEELYNASYGTGREIMAY